jgi:small-conductance mechanosensitive channel
VQSRFDSAFELMSDFSTLEIRILETLVIILVLLVVRWLLLGLVRRQTQDVRTRYHWSKGVTYVLAAVALFVITRVWFVGFHSITTFLGIVAAGLVIALKEPLLNMAAWFYLMSRRPFVVGDRIQIGTHIGDVIDQRLLEFTVLEVGNWVGSDQTTGRVIHVPNGRVFTDSVANYTRGFPFIWNELQLVVTFESDWQGAKDVLLAIATRHAHHLSEEDEALLLHEISSFTIFYATLDARVYTSVVERGVALTARYLCDARRRRETEQAITEDALRAFAARGDIDLAYPTRRFFDRATETRTLAPDAERPE